MRTNSNMSRNANYSSQKSHLMRKIREYDFAIFETVLFLDTHPNNLKALKYYSKLQNEREKLIAEHEANIGPITMHGNKNENRWDWVSGPWPWEGEN